MEFLIPRQEFEEIIKQTQQRTFDEEIKILEEKMPIRKWLQTGLKTNFDEGISSEQVNLATRKRFYGGNQKPIKQPPGFCELVWETLKQFILRILIVAACLTIIVQVAVATEEERKTAWIEGFAILVAVFIVVIVTAINDYQKERQFLKLNSQRQKQKIITVLRNGEITQIHQDYVLVGDIVNIQGGMQVPADGILIQANQIATDQSAMTGETKPIKKNTLQQCILKRKKFEISNQTKSSHAIPTPIMLSGTSVLTGEGKMIVTVVGDLSCLGKIRQILVQENQSTPLQNKLEVIAEDIGKFGLISAIVILVVLLIRFGVEKGISQQWSWEKDIVQIIHFIILALTVIVVAIPEGLPLAVTLSLAYSVKKMLDDQNLVRRLQACQTMGGADNICSDKTGTLTRNQMTLTHLWNETLIDLPSHKEEINIQMYLDNEDFIKIFFQALAFNQNSQLKTEKLAQKGNATEIAILKFLTKCSFDYQEQKLAFPIDTRKPFNSDRKRMSTVVLHQDKKIAFLKGASQIVLQSCGQYMSHISGKCKIIDHNILQDINSNITHMAKKSLRTLCVAYKEVSSKENLQNCDSQGIFQFEKKDFTLLAILGIRDIPREQVPQALRKCRKAGIKVRMVTGDNLITAKAIAEQIGIINSEDENTLIMQGKQFYEQIGGIICKSCQTQKCQCPINKKEAEKLDLPIDKIRVDVIKNMKAFNQIQPRLLVLARSRPEDKYALVTGLKQKGSIVAVTGDGTNDAPALKKANVGFSMGISGTEVAKEASDIILLDDNFESIVKAVLWGRNIYDSIRKFIQFQLTVNVIAVGITLIGAAFFKQEVLSPIQMLWLNLIMDTLGSLALATEPPIEKLLDRPPHKKDDYIVSSTMMKHIIIMGFFQLAVLCVLLFAGDLFIPQFEDSFDETEGFMREWKYTENNMIRSGKQLTIAGEIDYQNIFDETKNYSRHMTFIFNTFVMMQIFNFINCRKIHNEKNIFSNIGNNPIFIAIVLAIFLLQIILVTFGGFAFGVYSYFGLHPYQWLISIGIGSLCLIVRLIATFIPDFKCCVKHEEEKDFSKTHDRILELKRVDETVERDISYIHLVN